MQTKKKKLLQSYTPCLDNQPIKIWFKHMVSTVVSYLNNNRLVAT